MSKNRLNAGAIPELGAGNHPDGGNLYLRVIGGSRTYSFRYKRGGKSHWLTLGSTDNWTLAEARKRARAYRRRLDDGADLAAEVKAARAPNEPGVTFGAVAKDYIASHQAGWRSEKHGKQWQATLDQHAADLMKSPVADITTDDVLAVLRPIWTEKTETAARLRGRIEAILDAATVKGQRKGDNPARWRGHLDALLPKRSAVAPVVHQAALPWKALPGVCRQLQANGSTSYMATLFIALCATRSAEARGATWAEIDLAAKVWTIPAARTKGGRDHAIPLSDAALGVLAAMGARHGTTGLVFPGGKPGKPLSDVSVSKALHGAAGTTDTTVHGLRSAFRDWAGENAIAAEVAEMCLAHANRDKVEAAYARSNLLDRRRPVMQAWGCYCVPLSE